MSNSERPIFRTADGYLLDLTLRYRQPTPAEIDREIQLSFLKAWNSCFIDENAECRITEAVKAFNEMHGVTNERHSGTDNEKTKADPCT